MPDYPPEAASAGFQALQASSWYYEWECGDITEEGIVKLVLEAATRFIEQDIRTRIAASLRRAAEGRREYAAGLGEDGTEGKTKATLLAAADAHDSSAHIAVDPRGIMSVIPSWRWTDEEHASLKERPGT